MQNIISKASIEELIRAEKIAIKYSPKLALMIAKAYWYKQKV